MSHSIARRGRASFCLVGFEKDPGGRTRMGQAISRDDNSWRAWLDATRRRRGRGGEGGSWCWTSQVSVRCWTHDACRGALAFG